MAWTHILWVVLIWVISAIPLYFAVKLLGGRATLLKVILVNLLVGFLSGAIDSYFTSGIIASVVGFVVLLLVYKIMFSMGWIRAVLAWLLQFVLIAIFYIVLGLIGISLFFL